MIVNTSRLFAQLLSHMRISTVCDIGSMNGADALSFTAAAPQATVYAFEPNPTNLRLMQAHHALYERNIGVVPLAVSNRDGEAEFFVVQADYTRSDPRRGMSSLHRRSAECTSADVVMVRTTRLDTFLAEKCQSAARLALWIDAEGSAYEVIDGLGDLAERVHLVHVEVETSACIGMDQKLYPEVKAQLQRLGLAELATDQPHWHVQFNAVFARLDGSLVRCWQLIARLLRARLRYLVVRSLDRLCPACVRRYQALRRGVG